MWWPFKTKTEEEPVIDSRFQPGDRVYFKHRGDRTYGRIYRIYSGKDGEILYDIQVGGQCPYFLYEMKEDVLTLQKNEERSR